MLVSRASGTNRRFAIASHPIASQKRCACACAFLCFSFRGLHMLGPPNRTFRKQTFSWPIVPECAQGQPRTMMKPPWDTTSTILGAAHAASAHAACARGARATRHTRWGHGRDAVGVLRCGGGRTFKKKSHHDLGVENPIPLYGMVWLWVPRVLYLLRVPSLVQKQVLRRSGRSARGAVETSALSHLCPRDEGRGTGSDRGFALDLQGSRESRGMGARQTGVATLIPRP